MRSGMLSSRSSLPSSVATWPLRPLSVAVAMIIGVATIGSMLAERSGVHRGPLAWLAQRLLNARGDLVVAPETAIPLLPEQLGADYWGPLRQRFQSGDIAAVVSNPDLLPPEVVERLVLGR